MDLTPDVVLLLEEVSTELKRRSEIVLLVSERLLVCYLMAERAHKQTVNPIARAA